MFLPKFIISISKPLSSIFPQLVGKHEIGLEPGFAHEEVRTVTDVCKDSAGAA